MSIESTRALAAEYEERALACGSSYEHPESARLGKAAGALNAAANELEVAQAEIARLQGVLEDERQAAVQASEALTAEIAKLKADAAAAARVTK